MEPEVTQALLAALRCAVIRAETLMAEALLASQQKPYWLRLQVIRAEVVTGRNTPEPGATMHTYQISTVYRYASRC